MINVNLPFNSQSGCSFSRHFASLLRNVGVLYCNLLGATCKLKLQIVPEYRKLNSAYG